MSGRLALLRETCLVKVVLIVRLEVKGCDTIEQHSDIVAEESRRMAHAYVLYYLMLMVAEIVKVAVYRR